MGRKQDMYITFTSFADICYFNENHCIVTLAM